jgi:hypothetical protein
LYVAQAFGAHASMTCKRIEQLPAVSDPRTQEQVEAYVRALPGVKTFQIKQINSRFFVVAPDEESCKNVHCYYRLLDTKNGIKEVFGFRGTGVIWLILSPVEVPVDFFQDDYSRIGFETPEKTYIGVALPHSGNAVIVEGVPADQLKLLPQSCRTGSK